LKEADINESEEAVIDSEEELEVDGSFSLEHNEVEPHLTSFETEEDVETNEVEDGLWDYREPKKVDWKGTHIYFPDEEDTNTPEKPSEPLPDLENKMEAIKLDATAQQELPPTGTQNIH